MKRLGIALLFVAACGGGSDGSGVDGSKTLVSLSASEQQDLCEYVVAAQGGEGHVEDCGNGTTFETGTVAECVADFGDFTAGCTATVSDAEGCADALSDPCNLDSLPEPCSFLVECSASQ
jgi:hypothetical protein